MICLHHVLADQPPLQVLLHPLGLSNVRSTRLIAFSREFLQSRFCQNDLSAPSSSKYVDKESTTILAKDIDKQIRAFSGAGRYASESFMIYSSILAGGGAPSREDEWLDENIDLQKETSDEARVRRTAISSRRAKGSDSDDLWRTVRPRGEGLFPYSYFAGTLS